MGGPFSISRSMVQIEATPGEQASRAAGFWDDFYAAGGCERDQTLPDEGATAPGEEENPKFVSSAGGGIEWILEPEVVLPGILGALGKLSLRPRRIVEIGCGDSRLAQRLYEALVSLCHHR